MKIERKRQFMYRGRTIEELKELDTREFAKLLPSRERRSVLRNFDVIEKFIKKCEKKKKQKKPILTHKRELIIVPKMINSIVKVYDGQNYIQVKILPEMLGHRLGEFAVSRKRVQHGSPGIGATRSSAALSVK